MSTALPEYIRKQDVPVFSMAAKHFDVFILVRKTNLDSLKYVGIGGFVPKRFDCKAKTADFNFNDPDHGLKETAGLVVDASLPGMMSAFKDSKQASATREWLKFESHVYYPKPDQKRVYLPPNIVYTVDLDPKSKHYGCVVICPAGLASQRFYIHGDYDLYAIVRATDPTTNERALGEMLGMAHGRGRDTLDVQTYINRRLGVAMILHGENEKFMDHAEDNLLVFRPDGTSTFLDGESAIRRFYDTELQGRKAFMSGELPSGMQQYKYHRA